MTTITKLLAAGAAVAALAFAAPAAAQFFPGYPGYGYPGGAMPGYGPGYGYPGYGTGYNVPGGSRIAASQCRVAVQQRLGGYSAYGYAGGYAAVPRINSVELRPEGGYRVRGFVSTGGYGGGLMPFTCRTDARGLVVSVGFNNRDRDGDYDRDDYYGNGYNGNGYYGNGYYGSDPNNPYAVYGYSRY